MQKPHFVEFFRELMRNEGVEEKYADEELSDFLASSDVASSEKRIKDFENELSLDGKLKKPLLFSEKIKGPKKSGKSSKAIEENSKNNEERIIGE